MRRSPPAAVLLLPLLVLAACDGDGNAPVEADPSPATPWGTWLLESGGMLPTFVAGTATFGTVTADVTAMVLNADGTARFHLRDRLTGAQDCVRAFVLYDDGELLFDFAAELTADFVFNLALEDITFRFPSVVVEDDRLGLAAEDGQIAFFSRVEQLPGTVACVPPAVTARFDGLPRPAFFTDLVLLGDDLVYSTSSMLEVFDPDTDTLGTPLGATDSRLVQTTQSGLVWTHCGCGGSRDAFQRTLAMVTDTVSSEDEIGEPITFRAMAYDATTDRLWIHGRAFDDPFGTFYVMNTAGEPDVIDREVPFNRDVRALAFDGSDLWGIVTVATQSIVRIDTDTGSVVENFDVPDEDVSYAGLVISGNDLYLLGTDLADEGVLFRATRPR